MATVVAVVGTIAGAGTTTVVTALGTALGEQRRQVAIVDATAAGSRLADAIELDGGGEVTDALRRNTAVPEVRADAPHDVAAFPAAPETNWGAVRPDAVGDLYDQLRNRFEFVLVDCGNEPSVDRAAWLGRADEVVIVTDPDVAGAVPEIGALARAFDVPVRGALANRVPPKEVEDAIEALDETDRTVLGVLPEDATVGAAAASRTSVLRTEPDSPIATSVWEFALRFRQGDHDDPVVPTGTLPDSMTQTHEPEEGSQEAPDRGLEGETAGETPDESTPDGPIPDESTEDAANEPTAVDSDPTADSVPGTSDSSTAPTPGSGGVATADQTVGSHTSDGEAEESADDATAMPSAAADDETPTPSPVDDGFETPDPQPVEESGSSDPDGDGEDDAAQPPNDEADDAPGAPDADAGGASTPDPSRAAAQDSDGVDGFEDDVPSDGARTDDRRSEDESSGIDDLDLGRSSDDGNGGSNGDEDVDTATDSSASTFGTSTDDADVDHDDSGDVRADESDDESAELSDEEIEAVFQETMQRVKERREQEEAERDE